MDPVWDTSCKDWETRVVNKLPMIPFPPLFPEEARSALEVFDALRVVDVIGSPTMAEACLPWTRDFVAAIFGAYNPETGRRLIREYLLLISKKNSKSTTAAGIMLTALIRNWRMSGEFLILAPTIEIANNSFWPARDMVRNDEELSDLLQVQDHLRQITHRGTNATLKVVAADSETVGGKKAIGVLVDELWLLGKQPKASAMLREATGGLAARPEGFVIFLSTQSDEPPSGVFAQKLKYARGVRDGRIVDNKFLPVIYEFPPSMIENKAHRNPKNFYVTNPNLNVSVDMEFLLHELQKAEDEGEKELRGFFAKFLNVEIGLALGTDRWVGANFWEQQAEPLTLKELIERSEVIVFGIDGGGLDDLLGAAAIGRDPITQQWLLWTHAWAHPSVLELRKSEASKLEDFRNDGDLTFVNRIGDDVEELAHIVATIEQSGKLDKVGVDPHGLGGIIDALKLAKVPEEKIIGISQGWKLVGTIKTTERKLAGGELVHGGQRMMNWCVGNARVVPAGNAILITKQVSGSAKIDPLMAAFNAVALMSLNPMPKVPQLHFI